MKRQPITHLILDTSSTSIDDNGGCDHCLIPMTVGYIRYLLRYMDEVRRLHRADQGVYSLECWDATASFFSNNEKMQELRDINSTLAVEVPGSEPILLAADPHFKEEDLQRVDCQSVQILSEDVWWTAYARHTSIRIETAHLEKKVLLRILGSLGGKRDRSTQAKPVHPAVQAIHDLLYLDMKDRRQFYNDTKAWDSSTVSAVAEIIAEYIPRPALGPVVPTDGKGKPHANVEV
jgi:hypothetical protein